LEETFSGAVVVVVVVADVVVVVGVGDVISLSFEVVVVVVVVGEEMVSVRFCCASLGEFDSVFCFLLFELIEEPEDGED